MSEVMTSRIGRFEILDSLGDSVAGNHYRAFDPATNRNIAVETFRLGTLPNDAAREAFVQGLKRSAHLLHPRIASVFDVGVDNDLAYVASEDLAGKPLDQSMLESGPFDLAEIVPVIRQIGAALDYAHEQGVVHGGLEPSRVLVLASGEVKIVGFGSEFPAVKTPQGAHTIVGEPKYFSPERVRGEALTHRADIFSLGTIVYEMLTGQAPFDSDSLITSLYRVVNEPHRPARELRPGLPEGIDEALDYALAKQPKDRYLSCATLIDSLEALVPAAVPVVEPAVAAAATATATATDTETQYCDQCGSELQTKMKFCWSCGATVVVSEAGAAPVPVPVAAPVPVPVPVVTPVVPDAADETMPMPDAPETVRSKPTVATAASDLDFSNAEIDRDAETVPVIASTPASSKSTAQTKAPERPAVVASGSASTSKSNAVRSRSTVAMDAVEDGVEVLNVPHRVKVPARTEVAAAVHALPPPLSGYAMSTGTKDLPAPGAVIDAAPAKPSALRAMLPLIIFAVILLVFAGLGFWFAPRFLGPKQQTVPPPAAESVVPGEGQSGSTEAAPATEGTPTAEPAPAPANP